MNLDKFMEIGAEQPVALSLQKAIKLGDQGAYKIICECSKKSFTDEQIKKAVSNVFGNKVSVVEASIKDEKSNLVSMIVKANKRSLAFKGGNLPEGKKQITANIVADVNDNSIWEVVGSGDNKRLVLKADEDFEKIFDHNNRICTAAVLLKPTPVVAGDYVSFFDRKSSTIKAGFALTADEGEDYLVVDDQLEEFAVDPEEVIESADLTEFKINPIVACGDQKNSIKDLKEYLGKAYKDTKFFDALNDIMKVNSKVHANVVEAGILDTQMDEIKEEIKNFIIEQAVGELKDEIKNSSVAESEPEMVIVEESELAPNADGDLDFATDEEIEKLFQQEDCSEEQPVEADDQVDEEDSEAIEYDMNAPEIEADDSVEDVSFEDEDLDERLSEVLDESEIQVVSEAELDEGEFEPVEVEDLSNQQLLEKLSEILQ